MITLFIQAQQVKRVSDINTKKVSSSISEMAVLSNKLYIVDNNRIWAYDEAGPATMITDISYNSYYGIKYPTAFNGKLYYAADDNIHGSELWVFDGTHAPTMVADICPGSGSSKPLHLTVFNNKLYFVTNSYDINLKGLWVYDGSAAPSMITEKSSSYNNYNEIYSQLITVFKDKLYFVFDDGTNGSELWSYDGINEPFLAADICMGPGNGFPEYLTIFDNLLYFIAYNGLNGKALWAFDGSNSPVMVADFSNCPEGTTSAYPGNLIAFGEKLYFTATDCIHGTELWAYDGITLPAMVADIYSGTDGSYPAELIVFNNMLYYTANNGTNGMELWSYDGVEVPSMAWDICTGSDGSVPEILTVYHNKLYFIASYESSFKQELFSFDGNNPPTRVQKINCCTEGSGPDYLTVFDNKLLFGAADSVHGRELWEYDGVQQPILKADINSGSNGSSPAGLFPFHNMLYFSADDGYLGKELWGFDGTNPPELVANISDNMFGSRPNNFVEFNNKLYFSCFFSIYGQEIWVYDGTNAPVLAADIWDARNIPYSPHAVLMDLTVFNDRICINAGWMENDFWTFNGTDLPEKIVLGESGWKFYGGPFVVFNNSVYFAAGDLMHGVELWSYDGINPPELKADITSGAWGSWPILLGVFKNKLCFIASDSINGYELWSYDGSNVPTMLANISEGETSSNISGFAVYGDKLYFAANDGIHGQELWIYDGSNPPLMVADIRTGSLGSAPAFFAVFNNKLYFSAEDSHTGRELFVLCATSAAPKVTACGSYEFNGKVLTSTGIYCDTVPNAEGCDSIITLDLTITDTLDNTVSLSGEVLTASASGMQYQWIDCNNQYLPVEGAVNQAFHATKDGSYAVIISQYGCTDTSDCYKAKMTGIRVSPSDPSVSCYPNPTAGELTVVFDEGFESGKISVSNVNGEKVTDLPFTNSKALNLDVSGLTPGIYIIQVVGDNKVSRMKFIRE